MIQIEPTGDHPLPFDLSDEQPKTHKDAVAIAANTADMLEELGGSIDYSNQDLYTASQLIRGEDKPSEPRHITVLAEAKAASVLIKEFDFQAFADAQQARNYITNKLIKLSDCGDPKLELKALELLGKHSDVGLFTERSEITVTHKSSSDLEESIKDRIKRLLNTDVVDAEPLISELEAEKALQPVQEVLDAPLETEEDEADEENEGENGAT